MRIAELGVGLQVQLHDPLAGRELLAGVERPSRRSAGRAGDRRGAGGGAAGRRGVGAAAARRGRPPRLPRGVPGGPGAGVRGVPARRRRAGATRAAPVRAGAAPGRADRLAVGPRHHRRAQRARARSEQRRYATRSSFVWSSDVVVLGDLLPVAFDGDREVVRGLELRVDLSALSGLVISRPLIAEMTSPFCRPIFANGPSGRMLNSRKPRACRP